MSTTGAAANNFNKKVIIINCASFADCMSKINNAQLDNAKGVDAMALMYKLIKYSDNYLKASAHFWQYYRHEPALTNADSIIDFIDDNNSASFKF